MRRAATCAWRRAAVALATALGLALPAHSQTAVVSITAVIVSKNTCRITSGKTATITFPAIDPSSTASITRSAAMSLSCNGKDNPATWALSIDAGLHADGSGNRRMINGTDGTFMTYSVVATPPSGTFVLKGPDLSFSIDATLAPSDFASATAGAYSDTVRVTLSP